MSLKQEILKQIRNLLNEAIQNITPSDHQKYIREMSIWAEARNKELNAEELIQEFDIALKNKESTDQFYYKLGNLIPFLQGFIIEHKPPKNYVYNIAQDPSKDFVGPPAPSGTPASKKISSAASAPRYFVCKMPAEIEATKNFQKSKNLTPDGKIGKLTYAAILADPSVLSGGEPFAQKGKKFNEVLGLIDPKMKKIHQRSVCEALAETGEAWISGAKLDTKSGQEIDPTNKYGSTVEKSKCPSFIKPTGPYTFEEIKQYVPNYLQSAQKNDDSLILAIASAVTIAAKRSPSVGCEELIGFIQGAIKTKGMSVPGLSKIKTPEQDAKSYELDKLNAARAYASQGITADKVGDPEVVAVGKKYGVFEESKNWLDRTRETTASNLFERLVRDTAKK
jgi:hypothetical protein